LIEVSKTNDNTINSSKYIDKNDKFDKFTEDRLQNSLHDINSKISFIIDQNKNNSLEFKDNSFNNSFRNERERKLSINSLNEKESSKLNFQDVK